MVKINDKPAKTTPVNADQFLILDSADLEGSDPKVKNITFQNLSASIGGGEFIAINEGGNDGWAINGVSRTSKDTIGSNAVDLSIGTTGGASGIGSFAEGLNNEASGDYSHAEGSSTVASALYSHSEGYNTNATGVHSHAEGSQTTAAGRWSHAEGAFSSVTAGDAGHAEGYQTEVTSGYAHAEGNATTASGTASHAEGNGSLSGGDYSHAEGTQTTALGTASHAEGNNTYAEGEYSHVEGDQTGAIGLCAHAEGRLSTASGDYAHAECQSTASGDYAHSEGDATTASGTAAHSEGNSTTASGDESHSEGLLTLAGQSCSNAKGRSSSTNFYSSMAHASGEFDNKGDAQYERVVLMALTTDATPTVMYPNNFSPNTIPVNDSYIYAFSCRIVAKTNASSPVVCSDYQIDGTISRDNASNTVLNWSNVSTNFESASLSGASVAAVANDTAETLEIQVTGVAATNIRWVGTLEITRVNY